MLLVPFNEMTVLNERGSGDPVCCQPEDALLVPAVLIHQIHIANAVPIAIIDIPVALTAPGVTNPDEYLIKKISSTSIPALYLLIGYTKMLIQVGDNLSPDLTVLVSTQIQDLVTLLIGPKREETQVTSKCGLRAARFEAVKHDILEHIAESELSITQVVRRQGISPQYIRCPVTLSHNSSHIVAHPTARHHKVGLYQRFPNGLFGLGNSSLTARTHHLIIMTFTTLFMNRQVIIV